MSEEDLENNKTYISDFDITKHIVLDNESNYWYSAEYVDKMLKKQDKEIERLNNIINELEKGIENMWVDNSGDDIWQYEEEMCLYREEFLDKIKELKGSDKE